jgi:hypothetical protein
MPFKEFPGDVYNVFSRLARAAGGFIKAAAK